MEYKSDTVEDTDVKVKGVDLEVMKSTTISQVEVHTADVYILENLCTGIKVKQIYILLVSWPAIKVLVLHLYKCIKIGPRMPTKHNVIGETKLGNPHVGIREY